MVQFLSVFPVMKSLYMALSLALASLNSQLLTLAIMSLAAQANISALVLPLSAYFSNRKSFGIRGGSVLIVVQLLPKAEAKRIACSAKPRHSHVGLIFYGNMSYSRQIG